MDDRKAIAHALAFAAVVDNSAGPHLPTDDIHCAYDSTLTY